MTIQPGDSIPDITLRRMGPEGPEEVGAREYFSDRRVVLFAVPGAFTPTCSAKHLPGFIAHHDDFRDAGIDALACVSVNDVFVMHAWGRHAGAEGIDMLADGNGDFTRALGLEADSRAWGMGMRSRRFALVANNARIEQLFVEEPGEFVVSSAEHVLNAIRGDA